jgi:hypothetical protein
MLSRNKTKTIIALLFLAIIIAGGIWEMIYVKRVFDELDGRLDALLTSVIAEDSPTSMGKTEELAEWWEQKKCVLEHLVFSADLRAMSVAIGEVKGSLYKEDFMNAASKVTSLFAISQNLRELMCFDSKDII